MSYRRYNRHVMDFFRSVIEGEEDGITYYLKDGYDVDEMMEYDDYEGEVSALMIANQNNQFDMIKTLLSYGANISHITQFYTRALVHASHQKMAHSLRLLGASGLFRGVKDEKMCHYKELINCVQSGDFEKVTCLISDSCKQITADNQGENTLSFLILSGFLTSHLGHVIENVKVDVNGYNSRGFTPLISAVIAGDLESIDFLIGKGADVNKTEMIRMVGDFECSWVKSEISVDDIDKNIQNGGILDSDYKTPLMYAVWTGNLEVVKHLLATENVDIGCDDSQRRTALVHAVYGGNLEIVDELLRNEANVNFKDYKTGESVLFQVVNAGSEENIVKSILNAGADKNKLDRGGKTALLHAAKIGKADVMRVFLSEGGFDINYLTSNDEFSALMFAAKYKNFDCLKTLIDYGADINLENSDEVTVFDIAALFSDVACVKLLLESQQGSKHENNVKKSIHSAVKNENIEILKLLMPYCKDYINEFDDYGMTPLINATKSKEGHLENINYLLKNGADINIQEGDGTTALMCALEGDHMNCFKLLIQAGADINYVPDERDTYLIEAARKEDTDYLEILFQQGTQQVNTLSKCTGITPLIAAVRKNRDEHICLLLDHGADLNLPDDKGCTPIMHSVMSRWPEGLQLLLEKGADVNVVDKNEQTLWLDAMRSWECLKILLEDGAVLDNEKSGKKLKRVHLDSGIYMSFRWDVKRLLLIFDYGIFDWDWFVSGEQLSQIDKIAFAAVNVKNNSPVLFESINGEMTSLLQEAFLGNAYPTVRFLLANLFLTMEDYRSLVSDSEFKQRMREKEDEISDTVSIFNRISSQPWRLETLSFLTISGLLALPSNEPAILSRSERVDSLTLPEMFKTRLKFENVVSKLCPDDWKTIGMKPNGLEDDLLAVFKPLYPYEQNLSQCEEDCYSCVGFGYKMS